MISVNKYGYRAFEEMLDNAEELNIEVSELSNGATVVDAGINAPGGYGAGMYLSRLCLADLADLKYISYHLGDPVCRLENYRGEVLCNGLRSGAGAFVGSKGAL
jgi:methenyltetrahydromethanopterin cyclohydrolase